MNIWVFVGVMLCVEIGLLELTESLSAFPSIVIMVGGLFFVALLLNKIFPKIDGKTEGKR